MGSRYEVEITITSAKDLKNVNWRHGKLKPYAVAWVDSNSKCSTRVDEEGDDSPTWNHKLVIPFNSPVEESTLYIDIVHANDSGEDTKPLVGSAKLPLAEVVEEVGLGNRSDRKLKIKRPSGRPHGKVEVNVCVRDPRFQAPQQYGDGYGGAPPTVTRDYSPAQQYGYQPAAYEAQPYGSGYGSQPPAYGGGGGYGAQPPAYGGGGGYGSQAPQGYEQGGYQGGEGHQGYGEEKEKKSKFGGMGTGLAVGAVAGVLGGIALSQGFDALTDNIAEDAAEKVEEEREEEEEEEREEREEEEEEEREKREEEREEREEEEEEEREKREEEEEEENYGSD